MKSSDKFPALTVPDDNYLIVALHALWSKKFGDAELQIWEWREHDRLQRRDDSLMRSFGLNAILTTLVVVLGYLGVATHFFPKYGALYVWLVLAQLAFHIVVLVYSFWRYGKVQKTYSSNKRHLYFNLRKQWECTWRLVAHNMQEDFGSREWISRRLKEIRNKISELTPPKGQDAARDVETRIAYLDTHREALINLSTLMREFEIAKFPVSRQVSTSVNFTVVAAGT